VTDQPALPDRIKKTIGPTMLLGLQDAELDGEGGQQRIREWVDWIAEAVAPLVADEVEAEVDRIRAAVTEGKGIGRPLTASDVMVAHEVTRKALAHVLDAGLHLNWPQLVDEAQRAHEANAAWKADVDRVRALHYKQGAYCAICTEDFGRLSAPYPCPTIQALDSKETSR
jgi:hypothetical protein